MKAKAFPKTLMKMAGGALLSMAAASGSAIAADFDVAWARGAAVDPVAAYGDAIVFRVLRDGEPVGRHTVQFTRRGEDIVARARFDLEVRFLFVTAYRYTYSSTGVWRGGRLSTLSVDTNDDGTASRVVAEPAGNVLRVDGPRGREDAPIGIFPTNHWHPGVLTQSQVLNTITGEVNDVRIVERGIEQVEVNGEQRPARRFDYTGDLSNTVWYDSEGRWVKMRFSAKDGSTIDYECVTCRNVASNPA